MCMSYKQARMDWTWRIVHYRRLRLLMKDEVRRRLCVIWNAFIVDRLPLKWRMFRRVVLLKMFAILGIYSRMKSDSG